MQHRPTSGNRRGFTLVELLVVIGIIALLISILLPTLSQARKSAKALSCLSNMRQAGQGLAFYTNAYDGFIPGSNLTSGIALLADVDIADDNLPVRLGSFDYLTPIAVELGIDFNDGPTIDDRADRYAELTGPGSVFACPENADGVATAFTGSGGADVGTMPYVSYSTGALFMYKPNGTGGVPNVTGRSLNRIAYPQFYSLPQGYGPKITKVGGGSNKVFLGEGSRFVNGTFPSYNFEYLANTGGNFSTWGPFSRFGRAMNREGAPANAGQSSGNDAFDSRALWARHGTGRNFGPGGAFATNLVFFDGHGEKQNDLEASNPAQWAPSGTGISPGEMWNDTRETFLGDDPVLNSDGDWVVP